MRELVERAFAEVGIDDWQRYVRQDAKFFRPAEVDLLIGDASKARERLGWRPEVDFPTLVKMMVASDLQAEANKANIDPAVTTDGCLLTIRSCDADRSLGRGATTPRACR